MLPFLDALRQDGDALLAAARVDLSAPVPTCPGWNVRHLVEHVGMVHSSVSKQARSIDRVPFGGDPPAGDAVLDWYAENLAQVLLVLTETPPDAPSWNWSREAPKVAGFWRRRMAHETAMHRWDAEHATGSAAPITGWLACDGISEMLDEFLKRRRGRAKEEITGTVHLHATDPADGVPSEWFIELEPRGVTTWQEGHRKGDAVLRGPASELLLTVWNRPASVDRIGDETLIGAIRAE